MMAILRASGWCNTHGQGLVRTFVLTEESLAASRRVTGSSVARRVRLWRIEPAREADVTGAADAQDLQIDASRA